ncbi:MAG: hypothetical protein J5724_01830 [Ruminococcus sp.]|nr:hypothetical protein [Ruminococcus sp.]
MKNRTVWAVIAAVLLTGCSAKESKVQDNAKDETTTVTTEVTSTVTSAETTTAKETTTKKTTAKVTTTKATTVQTTTAASTTEAQTTATPQNTTSPAPVKHYTLEGYDGPEEIPEAEWNALTKVNEKYGTTFEVIARTLCWESMPSSILNDDGTTSTIPVDRDYNKPLVVAYSLKGSDGVAFEVYLKENTDVIIDDTYLYYHYVEQLHNEAAGSLRKLVPGGKVYFFGMDNGRLPFESPAQMTYEEFRQALADNKGSVFGDVFVAEGMDVSDDMRAYSPRRGQGQPGEYGYILKFHVNQVSQEDYDSLDDIMAEYPVGIKSKLIN